MLRIGLLLPCCVLSFGFLSQLSYSQTEERKDTAKTYLVEEVVVTATRTSKKIIDIPYPIVRIQNTQYRFDRKVSLDDIVESVPGLFFQNRYGNHDVRISIRGFGSRSNSGIRGVRILMDGIPESEPDGQTRIEAIDFQSIGSIEIVKGNSSSLYTNAPGGVINFINDVNFTETFAVNFNEFGSFGLRRNGFKTGIRTKNYRYLTTYSYHNARGYRQHSEDSWHILNAVGESTQDDDSRLYLSSYFVDGIIRLPGSLTRQQFDADPFQPNSRDVGRDAKRITKKGRLGVQFDTFLDEDKINELQLVGYGTFKYFERAAQTYRIINRSGVGGSARFVHHDPLFGMKNEFSIGGDLSYQTGPVEEHQNIGGRKDDPIVRLVDETIGNAGFYFVNTLSIVENRLDLLVSGRYDKIVFDNTRLDFEVQNSTRRFEAFTPKAAMNFKITPSVAAYASYGFSFDSPAANELDNPATSTNPFATLLNPDLEPQRSRNFEAGVKGSLRETDGVPFMSINFEVTAFNSVIDDEIVPFEIFGDVFFRNSARTNRRGLEVGADMEIVKGLRWKTAYTLSQFTYDTYTARTIELDTLGNIVTIDRDFGENVVPSTPKHNVSTSLSYEHRLTEQITGFVKGGYVNISGMHADDRNSEQTAGYALFNSTIGLDVTLDRFNILLSGGVDNISNRTYVAFVNINSATNEFYEAGEPRTFFAGIQFGYTF